MGIGLVRYRINTPQNIIERKNAIVVIENITKLNKINQLAIKEIIQIGRKYNVLVLLLGEKKLKYLNIEWVHLYRNPYLISENVNSKKIETREIVY